MRTLLEAGLDVFNNFKSNTFPIRSDTVPCKSPMGETSSQQEGGLEVLTPKQMLQRLSIALAQIKAGNNSKTLSNEIRQIVYSLYQSKKLLKRYIIT